MKQPITKTDITR